VTTYCAVVPNICGSSVSNLLHATSPLWSSEFWGSA